jgi:hypothetical protein
MRTVGPELLHSRSLQQLLSEASGTAAGRLVWMLSVNAVIAATARLVHCDFAALVALGILLMGRFNDLTV